MPCILVDRGIIEVTEGAIVRCVHDEQNILHSYYEVRRYNQGCAF